MHILMRQDSIYQLSHNKSLISLHEAIFTSNQEIAELYKTSTNPITCYPYHFIVENPELDPNQAMEHFLAQIAEEAYSQRIPGFYTLLPETNVNIPGLKPGKKAIDVFRVKFNEDYQTGNLSVSESASAEIKQHLLSNRLLKTREIMQKVQKTPSEDLHTQSLLKYMAYARLKGEIVYEPNKVFKFAGILVNSRQYDYSKKALESANQKELMKIAKSISKKDKDALIIMKGDVMNSIHDCDPDLF